MIITIMTYVNEHKDLVLKGVGSLFLMAVGWLDEVEIWFRICSLIVGLLLGIFTIYKVYLDIRIKHKHLKDGYGTPPRTNSSNSVLRDKKE